MFQADFARMVIIIIMTVIAGLFPGVSVIAMQRIINNLQENNGGMSELLFFIIVYAAIDIFSGLLAKFVAYQSFVVEKKSSINISLLILEKTKELELSDYEDMGTYDLIQRAQNESNGKIFNYFTFYLTILQSLITIITNVMILNRENMWFILILAVITVIRTAHLIWVGQKKYTIFRNRTSKERKKWYYQFLLTNDIAFKEIKIYDLYNHFIQKFRELSYDFFHQDRRISRNQNLVEALLTFVDCVASGLIFCYLILSSKMGRISIGDAVAYTRSISNIKTNIESFCFQIVVIWENTLYISQLFELLDIQKKGGGKAAEITDLDKIERIELINVSYRYENSASYTLRNINAVLDNEELFFLVGKNGSGKSTLVKLISGYYDNYEGIILINGINLREINKDCYRQKLGILLQDFTKYELTIRENVTLSNLANYSRDERVNTILGSLGFSGYSTLDTQLGYWFENGHQLSGGEWLKVALARAFNREADVYILDEPNSALDPIAETEILRYFSRLTDDNVGILVTHRISSITGSKGTIIVMDNGEIIKTGKHEELYAGCEIYRDLLNASAREDMYAKV